MLNNSNLLFSFHTDNNSVKRWKRGIFRDCCTVKMSQRCVVLVVCSGAACRPRHSDVRWRSRGPSSTPVLWHQFGVSGPVSVDVSAGHRMSLWSKTDMKVDCTQVLWLEEDRPPLILQKKSSSVFGADVECESWMLLCCGVPQCLYDSVRVFKGLMSVESESGGGGGNHALDLFCINIMVCEDLMPLVSPQCQWDMWRASLCGLCRVSSLSVVS